MQASLNNGSLAVGWGGVLDLLEDSSRPDSSPRKRCTVHMDFVPVPTGQQRDPTNIAFWTAEHCLKYFPTTQRAELYLFDPVARKYSRFRITIDEMDKFKAGEMLFSDRKSVLIPDAEAVSDYNAYLQAGSRVPVRYLDPSTGQEGPLIERGSDICISGTNAFKTATPNYTAVCSTVLDLARLTARVAPESATRPDVIDITQRLDQTLTTQEQNKFAFAEQKKLECMRVTECVQRFDDFKYFLTNWRNRVTDLTRWRRYAAQSSLIEKVRLCSDTNTSGMCSPDFKQLFKSHFKDALDEYTAWNRGGEFKTALRNEVYDPNKHNLQWLLKSQYDIQNYTTMSGSAQLGTNILRTAQSVSPEVEQKSLGESGATFYGLPTPLQMVAGTNSDPAALLIFSENKRTILVPFYKTAQQSALTLLLQPGDSGSTLLISNTPIGVVSTVDGKETSGGASVLPLPEYTEEESSSTSQANKAPGKSTVQTGCR